MVLRPSEHLVHVDAVRVRPVRVRMFTLAAGRDGRVGLRDRRVKWLQARFSARFPTPGHGCRARNGPEATIWALVTPGGTSSKKLMEKGLKLHFGAIAGVVYTFHI